MFAAIASGSRMIWILQLKNHGQYMFFGSLQQCKPCLLGYLHPEFPVFNGVQYRICSSHNLLVVSTDTCQQCILVLPNTCLKCTFGLKELTQGKVV